jgi:hypothetical protein
MLRIISKIYSLLIVTQIVSFEMVDAIHNNPFRRYGLILLTIPVIYHLIQELFFKNKSAENNTLKIYSFVYICFYALWCLFDIIYLIFTMGGISSYMAIMLYASAMLFLAPVIYSFAKNLFPKSKVPLYIFIAYVALTFGASYLPEVLNARGFYDTISD